jgi:hypothetical protein
MAKTKTEPESAAPAEENTAIYEVICHSVEIDGLLCYRTHRLRLTKAQAAQLNDLQADTVRFVGI